MTDLRAMMIKQMELSNFSPSTTYSYLKNIEKISLFYAKSPDKFTVEEVTDYLYFQQVERGLSYSTCNQIRCSITFFYRHVLHDNSLDVQLPKRKTQKKIPEILSQGEVSRVLDGTTDLRYRLIFELIYSAGLRGLEAVNLKVSHIDSQRMVIHIVQSKGHKDRLVTLSQTVLRNLREYWRIYRPEEYLFPSSALNRKPLSRSAVAKTFQKAKKQAGITKTGSLHMLRHSYATHMLEAGYTPETIQKLLGHTHISTTMQYLHATKDPGQVMSPLDMIQAKKKGPWENDDDTDK